MKLNDVFLHAAILIPIEFGLLHATPLGPMITGAFHDMFTGMGLNFGAAHVAGNTLVMG